MKRRRTTEEIREAKRKLAEEVEVEKQRIAEALLTALRDGRLERGLEEQVGRARPSTKH